MRLLAFSIALFCVTVAFVDRADAADDELSRRTLKGINGVYVSVESLADEVERAGLKRSQLQDQVESRLKKAGVRVLSHDEFLKDPALPMLYINLHTSLGDKMCAYTVSVQLQQAVKLRRDDSIQSQAVTWSMNSLGASEIPPPIKSVLDGVDDFIEAYLAANPKAPDAKAAS